MLIRMRKKISFIFPIFIFIILFFFLIVIIKNITEIKYESFSNESFNEKFAYYRCENKILGTVIKNIFDKNNIIQSNDDWNLYIPCGYNNVEEELKKIIIKNDKNKYVFGINGCDTIVSKNKIWESLVKCYGRKNASNLMPESYVLSDTMEMLIFSTDFNPSNNDIYILKKNIQRKEGLKLTKDYYEILESKNESYKVVQKYIRNLYLINQRKVNLRVYLLVVIKENQIYFYLGRIGKCIYTNKKYSDNDFDFESNITSYNLDMSVYEDNPRTFNELIEYINSNGDSGQFLFNKIEKLMKEISYCLAKNLYQSKNILKTISFQLFGADVIFENNLHPYLLEINKGPDMSPRDDIDDNMKNTVQTDMLKIVGILKDTNNNSFYMIHNDKVKEQ